MYNDSLDFFYRKMLPGLQMMNLHGESGKEGGKVDRSLSWVVKHVMEKECRRFVPVTDKPETCMCGTKNTKHTSDALKNASSDHTPWRINEDTVEVPTTAYGTIQFSGATRRSTAKVRMRMRFINQ